MSGIVLIIGGRSHSLPPVNFAAIEAAWPSVEGFPTARTLVDQTRLVVEIVSHIFVQAEEPRPEMTPLALKKQLKGDELVALVGKVPEILGAMGLVQKGEAQPAAETSGSSNSKG